MSRIKETLSKLNQQSPAAKAAFWFVISNIALKGMSFITTPIFTRVLEVADYGTTSVFVSWEGIISIFATLNLGGGVFNVAMTKYPEDTDRYTTSMLGLTALFSVFTYGICIAINLIWPALFQLDTPFLLYMWIQTFTNACITFWLMRKRFQYQYKPVILYTFLNALLSPAAALIAIALFPETKAYAKVIGAGIPGILFGVALLVYSLKKSWILFQKQYWKFALKFNIPLIPHFLAGGILTSSDKLMINSMVGKAEAGIYGIAHSIVGLLSIVTQSINYALIPYTLQSLKNQDTKRLSKSILGCSVLVSVVCIGILLFAKEGILIFSTEEYLDAIWFLLPLTIAAQFSFVSGIVGNMIYYYEKTKYMSVSTMICAAVNLILNYVGIRLFGYIAAGYTTLICSALRLLLYYIFALKCDKGVRQIVPIKWLFLISAATLGFLIYALVFYDKFLMRLGLVVLLAAAVIIFRKKLILMFRNMWEVKQRNE